MKRIALLILLITLYLAPQLPAQSTDSLLIERGRRLITSKTVQLWSLLHSYFLVNGTLPENMKQLQEHSENSTIIFDTSFISNYKSLDSVTASFDFNYTPDKGLVLNDTLTLLSISAKAVRISFVDLVHIIGDYYFEFSGEIQSASFIQSNRNIKIDSCVFSAFISSTNYTPLTRYIKIKHEYPPDSPEYISVLAIEKMRNNQMQQFFELFDPQQLDTVKVTFRKMFTDDFSDTIRFTVFGIKTVREYDRLSGAKVLNLLMGKYFGNGMGDCYLVGNDGFKILGSIQDDDVVRIMTKNKVRVLGKSVEQVENHELKKIKGQYYLRFPNEMRLALEGMLSSLKTEQ